jgi:hypothetical protein
MTNESLEEYIRMYNSGAFVTPIFQYRISPSVVFAKFWTEFPTGNVYPEESYNFYFIENKGVCVAIVLEMGTQDIHWFVDDGNRRRGILYKALHNSIFPHMFSDGRTGQSATAETSKNVSYLKRQGFVEQSGMGRGYYLSTDQVQKFNSEQVRRSPLSSETTKSLMHKLFKKASELKIIRDQLECAYGNDFNITDIANQLSDFACEIEFEIEDNSKPIGE